MTTSQYTCRGKLSSNIVNDTHESHYGDVILLCCMYKRIQQKERSYKVGKILIFQYIEAG